MPDKTLTIYKELHEKKLLTETQLKNALSVARSTNRKFTDILIEQDYIKEESLLNLMAELCEVSFDIIDKNTIDFRTAKIIPERFARQHNILPLFQLGNTLTVATTDPFNIKSMEEMEIMTRLQIEPILTTKKSIDSLYTYCYSFEESELTDETPMSSLFEMGMKLVEDIKDSDDEIFDLAQEAPIAKLVDTIIKQGITEQASDIHIEPEETIVKIRFRIDGLLKDVMTPPKKLESAIISRIKILANLDITETRKPQDGRMTFTIKEKDIDFRVSTVRTINGEKIVLRILDKTGAFVSLQKIGLLDHDYKQLQSLINSSSGIFIVCGPTGSGKTSTLYSALSQINLPEKNIITIEDPVEYNLDGINQIPVNHKIGMDFVSGLSAIVRQDPDVIMIGEIRDLETANISIQSALTGHMVFSTLHTRNAAGAVTRLLDMGIQPFLLNSSINGIMGQRLVRTICNNCKTQVKENEITGIKQSELLEIAKNHFPDGLQLFKGQGCKYCEGSGYKGRTGIFEILRLNENIAEHILVRASAEKIQDEAIKQGMTTMQLDGLNKVNSGLTTITEITRVLDV